MKGKNSTGLYNDANKNTNNKQWDRGINKDKTG